jgi:hypothetical protein
MYGVQQHHGISRSAGGFFGEKLSAMKWRIK